MPFEPGGFKEAVEESKGGGDAPPDGLHEVELTFAKIATRASDGYQWIVLSWKVVSGPHRDHEWESMHSLERYKPDGERNPGLVFTASTLRTVGVDVDNTPFGDADAIARAVMAFANRGYSVEVKTNGQFTNTYVKGQLDSYAPSLPGSATPAYGQPRNAPTNAIYGADASPQSLGDAGAPIRRENMQPTGESVVPSDVPWSPEYKEPAQATATVDRDAAPKKGDVDPETGEAIPF
jgi:hypothetical protein